MNEKIKVGILLVLHNSVKKLDVLINSIINQTHNSFELYSIDCNEKANEEKYLISLYPSAKLYPSSGNIGFAKANNLLAKKAIKDGCEYLFILNPDMELSPNTLESLVQLAKSDEQIGAVSSIVLYGNEKYSSNTIQLFGGRINYYNQKKKFLYLNESTNKIKLPKKLTVDFINGGSMMIKKELFEKIGLFNEDYFMYNDETEFGYRTMKAGYKIAVTSETKIYHHHKYEKNNKIGYYLMYYYMMRNRILFFKNNMLKIHLLKDIFFQIVLFPIKLKWLIKISDIKLVKYYYLGLWRGLKERPVKLILILNEN